MFPSWARRLGYYWLALFFVAASAALRWTAPDVLGPTPFLAFYLAWVGAAAFGGLGPGLLATVASWLCVEVLFDFTPARAFFGDSTEVGRFLILMAGGATVSLVAESMRRGRIRERHQRRELADLTELTSLGHLLIRDDRDRIVYWSEGCARLYGFTAEQALGRISHELLQTEFPQPLETIRAALHGTGRWEGELTQHRADGSVVHVASLWVLRDGAASPAVLEVNNDITDRKQAETALRETRNELEIRVQERTAQLRKAKELVETERQRFQNVLDQLPAYLVLLRPDHRVSFANRFFEERFGKSEDRRCYEYLFHRTEPCENCETYKALQADEPHHWEWTGPDGRDYDIHDFPFTDMDGSPLIMEVGLDITDRKRAETELEKHRRHLEELVQERTGQLEVANEQLREHTEELRMKSEELQAANEALGREKALSETTIESLPGIFYLIDFQGRFLKWNKGFERVSGYAAKEIARMHPLDFFEGQDRGLVEQKIQEVFTEGQSSAEFELVSKDGHKTPYFFTGMATLIGGVNCLIGTGIDITDRKRVEEALRQSEEQFHRLFEDDLTGDYISTPEGRILLCNPAFAEMFGFSSAQDAVGTSVLDLYIDPTERQPLWERLRTEGKTERLEAWRKRLDGEPIHIVENLVGHFNEQGELYEIKGYLFEDTARKRVEEALRINEQRLALAVKAAKSGTFDWDAKTNTNVWSDELLALYGMRPGEFGGRSEDWIACLVPEDRESGAAAIQRSLETGEFRIEFRIRRRDNGEIRWMDGRGQVFFDEAGKPTRMVGINMDVTERKQADEALRQSELFYRQTLESIPGMVFTTRPDGYCDYQSQQWVDYTGVPMAEHLGSGWNKLLHPEDRPRALAAWRDAVAGRASYELEYRVRRYDGQYEWFRVIGRPIRDEAGQIVRWFGVAMNIEAIKQAEKALQEAFAQAEEGRGILQAMMDHIPMGITIADAPDTNIRMISRYGRELIEKTSEELTDIPAEEHPQRWQIYHADGVTPAAAEELPLTRATQQGELVKEEEWVVTRRDGTKIPILCTAAPICDREGHITGGVIGWQDMTQRKRIEARLQRFNEELEREVQQRTAELLHRARQLQKLTLELSETEDRERKRIAEILHDDLQQQLAAAKFHLGLLRSRARHDPSLQATAAQIDHMLMEAIQKSRSLSHELSPAVMHHADFGETLRWLANQVRSKHGLIVRVHAHGEVRPQSDAIKGFLYKAAQELLFNIVKHARVNEANIRVRQSGGCICLTVSDRGRGFDPEGLRETAGFGLLNIRERIELLGGRMKIRSAPGRGSRFSISLPAKEQIEAPLSLDAQTTPLETVAPRSENRLRVLLADDHEIVRQGLASLLSEERSIEVVGEAANGREAVDLADRLHPDVVIMDVSMPLIDGDEATRQIKSRLPQTRVIALSMYEQSEKVEMMRRAGAERYVLKTAPSEELLAAIHGRTTAA